jgi:hypothetical protein
MDSRRFHAVFTRSVSEDVGNAFIGTRWRTPSPAIDNARIPVAAHAMQSYYNFDVEGMQQRSSQVFSSALVLHLRARECGHL